jgi:sugar phosphate isomerase/epimerase
MNIRYVGCAWIPHGKTLTMEDADKAIALFNTAGGLLQKQGIHFFYHAHGYEFLPMGDSTLFNYMAADMKKGVADFELDVFWAYHGGADPVLLMNKYKGRFVALHIKQMRTGEPTGVYTGNAPEESSVALPDGVLDFKAILNTAIQTGVKLFYIEDEAVTAVPQVKRTMEYLNGLAK